MKAVIKELLASKRVIMSLVGLVAWCVCQVGNARLGLGLDQEQLSAVLYPFVAYILGQSWKDGKQVDADSRRTPIYNSVDAVSSANAYTMGKVAEIIAEDPHKRTPDEIKAELAAYKGALGG